MTESDIDGIAQYIEVQLRHKNITEQAADVHYKQLAELRAGKWKRCVGCFNWVELEHIAHCSIYIGKYLPSPVPMVLCDECHHPKVGEEKLQQIGNNMKAYLEKGVDE